MGLAALADLGYPAGDESLLPMCDQVLDWWLSNSFYMEFDSTAEMALIKDPRCGDALDLREKKELPSGGWSAEGRFYNVSNIETNSPHGSHDSVGWGGIGKRGMNEWITADALFVLHAADRIIAKHP